MAGKLPYIRTANDGIRLARRLRPGQSVEAEFSSGIDMTYMSGLAVVEGAVFRTTGDTLRGYTAKLTRPEK